MKSEVVFCTYDSPTSIGGPFSDLGRLLPELRKHGVNCRVLALTHFGGTGPLIEGLRRRGFHVESTDCHNSIYEQIRWLLSHVNENPPAVFVPNFVPAALYASHWLRKAGAQTVGILHSDDKFYEAIQKIFVAGKSAWCLSDVVCVSKEIHEQVLRSSPQNTNAVYIPYGVKVPTEKWSKPKEVFRIAYVGRLVEEQKRISQVTKTLIATCQTIRGTEAVIYGDGPDRNIVENLIATAGNGLPIRLMGSATSDEVAKGLRDCHAITLLSEYEGLPIALLEGMANSCVAICRRMRSGIPQLIDHQKTGYLVSDSTSEFVETIRRLTTDHELTQTVAENGRNLILDQYSQEKTVQTWVDFLNPHLSDKAPKPFTVPRKINLPPRHPTLESTYSRPMHGSHIKNLFRYLRKRAGLIKNKLLSHR